MTAFQDYPCCPAIHLKLTMRSFSPVSVIQNVAVAALPEGGKNRFDSAPERPQVAFSAGGHGYRARGACNAEGAISRYNRLSQTIFGFRPAKNAPSDRFRSTKRKKINVVDRKSSE
jgi:hypothetical protein